MIFAEFSSYFICLKCEPISFTMIVEILLLSCILGNSSGRQEKQEQSFLPVDLPLPSRHWNRVLGRRVKLVHGVDVCRTKSSNEVERFTVLPQISYKLGV